MASSSSVPTTDWLISTWIWGLALGVGVIAGQFVVAEVSVLKLLILLAGVAMVLCTVARVEWGLLALVFITYTRFSDVMVKFHGAPSVTKYFVLLLLVVIAVRWGWYGRRPIGWERPALMMVGYGLVGLASLLVAADIARSQYALIEYVEDSLIAVTVTALLYRGVIMRGVIWSLLAAGLFLGTLSVYQQLTGTFDNVYWGFAQSSVEHIVGEANDYRLAGPIGDANFYAQILLVLVPLALDRFWNERILPLRLLALLTLAVCLLAIVFTFSRGAFVGLAVMVAIFMVRHPPRPFVLIITIGFGIGLLQFVPAQYTDRVASLKDAIPLFGGNVHEDGAVRNRTSEMVVGWLMFTDHPLLGVGLNNYPAYYQRYSRRVGLDPRLEERSAHSLYLEVAAETGLLGLTAFGTLLYVMWTGLRRAQRDLVKAELHDYAGMVAALHIGMIGYLIAAIFLHDAFARFFWLLAGISWAVPQVAQYERHQRQYTLGADNACRTEVSHEPS